MCVWSTGGQTWSLNSLTAAGKKDLRYLSFTHLGWRSLSLKELLSALIVSCMGWEILSIIDDSFVIIFLSPTTCTESRGEPKTELAFLISVSSLFLSIVDILLLQQTTAEKMADATTVSKKVLRSAPCTPEFPQQVESALTFPVKCMGVMSPVQFFVQVNTQVLKSPLSLCPFPGCSPVSGGLDCACRNPLPGP